MKWEKLGRIFVPDRHYEWANTHASYPKAYRLDENLYRIYFASRDAKNQSHIGFLDMDIRNPSKILSLSSSPVLSPGRIGTFDDSGVIPCSIVKAQGRTYLYYMGISLSVTTPSRSFCGLAYLHDNLDRAERVSEAPILERTAAEPVSGGAACVHFDQTDGLFRIWYESCPGWIAAGDSLHAMLGIRHATSVDGMNWKRSTGYSIPPDESASYNSTPSVIVENGAYRMWYSHKSSGKYRIGYAESPDGVIWKPGKIQDGMDVSEFGWDSEEVAYPCVFVHGGVCHMLYNGNQYGRTGFGLARLTDGGPEVFR